MLQLGLLAGMMVDFDTMHAFHFRFAFVQSYCGMHVVVVLLDIVHAMNVT